MKNASANMMSFTKNGLKIQMDFHMGFAVGPQERCSVPVSTFNDNVPFT